MKKMLSLLVCGMLVVGMIGCESAEDTAEEAYNDAKDKVEDNATDRWEEENKRAIEEAKDTEAKEKEVRANKEALASDLESTIANSMGANYEVAVVIDDNGDCNIGIADTTTIYSGYDKETIKSLSKQYGLESGAISIQENAETVFVNAGYTDMNVTLMITGADYVPFMVVMHGIATYY